MQYDYFLFFEYIISCDFIYIYPEISQKRKLSINQPNIKWSSCPPQFRWSTNSGVMWSGVHVVHLVHLESNWSSPGIQVDFGQNLAGLSAKVNPPGLQMDMWNPVESTWNLWDSVKSSGFG